MIKSNWMRKTTILLIAAASLGVAAISISGETWRMDNPARIAGHKTTVLGHPRVISAPGGRAIWFNGIDDAIFLDVHPLAGAKTWTWEVIFRPDAGGAPEQRFFHLQENGTENRMLFEIRVMGGQWCLDSYVKSAADSATLLDRTRLHPLGPWYHAAAVYDGRQFRNYVDGVQQGAASVRFVPQNAGTASLGVRMNRVNYFKGAILAARMTPRALSPAEFMRVP